MVLFPGYWQLLSSAEVWTQIRTDRSKLFDTLSVFLKDIFEKIKNKNEKYY